MNLGGSEILVIIVVAVLVLGPDKLPNALRMLGRAMGEVKKFQDIAKTEIDKAMTLDTDGHSAPTEKSSEQNERTRKESDEDRKAIASPHEDRVASQDDTISAPVAPILDDSQ